MSILISMIRLTPDDLKRAQRQKKVTEEAEARLNDFNALIKAQNLIYFYRHCFLKNRIKKRKKVLTKKKVFNKQKFLRSEEKNASPVFPKKNFIPAPLLPEFRKIETMLLKATVLKTDRYKIF